MNALCLKHARGHLEKNLELGPLGGGIASMSEGAPVRPSVDFTTTIDTEGLKEAPVFFRVEGKLMVL